MNSENNSLESSKEELDDFLAAVLQRVERNRASGELDPSVDLHFERTFADLRSAASFSTLRLDELIDQISSALESRFSADTVASRIPGVSLLHRIIGRLTRRHVTPAYVAIEQCRQALLEASAHLTLLSKMTPALQQQPIASDIWDRMASLDALEAEVRLLRTRMDKAPD